MSPLEAQLRVSLIQTELRELGKAFGGRVGKIIEHAASVLNLVKDPSRS